MPSKRTAPPAKMAAAHHIGLANLTGFLSTTPDESGEDGCGWILVALKGREGRT